MTHRSVLFILIKTGCMLAAVLFFKGKDPVSDAAPSSEFALSDNELKRLLPIATAGDCKSAFSLSRHHTFWTRQYDESVKWLRIAARCDNVGIKTELILMLIDDESQAGTTLEINNLLLQIRRLNIPAAEEYEKLVALRRKNAQSGQSVSANKRTDKEH